MMKNLVRHVEKIRFGFNSQGTHRREYRKEIM